MALRQLRELELRKHSLQEAAPDAVITFTHDHCVAEFNRAAERVFGWNRADVIGRDVFDLFFPEPVRPALVEAMRRYHETGQVTHLDGRIQIKLKRANGAEIPTEMALTRVNTAAGTLFTLHVRDLRAERESADALRRSEKKHRIVLDTLREVIFQTDRAGVLTYLNLAWRRTSGYLVEDSLGRSLLDFTAIEDRYALQRLFDTLPAAMNDPLTIAPIEARFRTSEGAIRLAHVCLQPLADADGCVTGAVGTLDDITDRRAVEIRLREQLRLSHELLDAIPLPVVLKDRESAFIAVNRAWEEFYGVHRSDALGRPIEEVLAPDLVPRVRALEQRVLANGGIEIYDSLIRRGDGAMRDVHYSKAAVTRDDGTVTGTVTTMVDMTERRASEQAALRARERIETVNRELQTQLAFSRALLDAMPLPISVKDHNGRFTAVNRAWESFYGSTREAILNRTVLEIFGYDAPKDVILAERDLVTRGVQGTLTFEGKRQRADGATRDVIYYKTGFVGPDRTLAGVVTITADITEQKGADVPMYKGPGHFVQKPLARSGSMPQLGTEHAADTKTVVAQPITRLETQS